MHNIFRFFPRMDKAGDDKGGGGGGNTTTNTTENNAQTDLLKEIKAMREEITALKSKPKEEDKDDPNLKKIEDEKARKAKESSTQEKIVRAAKFNIRFDNFLKEYAGVIPDDAKEISKVASESDYPDELERASAMKASLMLSFFKEEKNQKLLSESQLARWKSYSALGAVGRNEEADAVYDAVFEPAVNHARSIRQAELRTKESAVKGSSDSDIIFKKVHEKLMRSIGSHKLNDVLHAQAKGLGLVTENS